MNKFTIYTDGSCDNMIYPNYGGWAYLILEDENIIEKRSGSDIHTTNNRMEMMAILESLLELPYESEVEIVTDSQYCIGSFSSKFKSKLNLDLINQYRSIVKEKNLDVSFKWVRSHNGDKYNEIVDKLANEEYEKASGKEITDYKRIKKDKEYRKDVLKNSKKNERDKMLAELVQGIINDNKPKEKDYIQNIVKDINLIFNH